MHSHIHRLLLAGVLVITAALPVAHAAAKKAEPPVVPDTIKVDPAYKLFLVGHATGVQIYSCTASGWTLSAPRAELVDDKGKFLMSHAGGPTWTARDGSKVTGARVNGVTVDPTAIPWLLLSASGTPGADGDRIAGTKFIQRVNTVGGLAPAPSTCTTVGAVKEIPYTADYYFWK